MWDGYEPQYFDSTTNCNWNNFFDKLFKKLVQFYARLYLVN